MYLLLRDQNGNANVQLHSAGYSYFTGGNVGVGTTLPTATLDIVGNKGTTDNRNFRIVYANGGALAGTELSGLTHLQSELSLSAWTALYAKQGTNSGTYAAVINGKSAFLNGNVGIGSSSPIATLDIKGSNALQPALNLDKTGTSGSSVELARFNAPGGSGSFNVALISAQTNGTNSANSILSIKPIATNGMSWVEGINVIAGGFVGIGTTDTKGNKLGVNGTIIANEITVKVYPWSDYVFADDYKLPSETENYIKQNKHLPDVPSAAEVEENGVKVGEMEAILLKKIEELTLLMIEQNKQLQEQLKVNKKQSEEMAELRQALNDLK
jgi:hypothetical protein